VVRVAVRLGYDGGLAEYVAVPAARLLVPLGDLDPRDAAPLSDAALTPYHAIKLALPKLVPGTSVDIPVGTAFQYRNTGDADLTFICVSMPPWPGDSEATYVEGKWPPTI
jgi:hypothetical protein